MPLLNLTYSELSSAIRGMDLKTFTPEQLRALKSLMGLKAGQIEKELASRSRKT